MKTNENYVDKINMILNRKSADDIISNNTENINSVQIDKITIMSEGIWDWGKCYRCRLTLKDDFIKFLEHNVSSSISLLDYADMTIYTHDSTGGYSIDYDTLRMYTYDKGIYNELDHSNRWEHNIYQPLKDVILSHEDKLIKFINDYDSHSIKSNINENYVDKIKNILSLSGNKSDLASTNRDTIKVEPDKITGKDYMALITFSDSNKKLLDECDPDLVSCGDLSDHAVIYAWRDKMTGNIILDYDTLFIRYTYEDDFSIHSKVIRGSSEFGLNIYNMLVALVKNDEPDIIRAIEKYELDNGITSPNVINENYVNKVRKILNNDRDLNDMSSSSTSYDDKVNHNSAIDNGDEIIIDDSFHGCYYMVIKVGTKNEELLKNAIYKESLKYPTIPNHECVIKSIESINIEAFDLDDRFVIEMDTISARYRVTWGDSQIGEFNISKDIPKLPLWEDVNLLLKNIVEEDRDKIIAKMKENRKN